MRRRIKARAVWVCLSLLAPIGFAAADQVTYQYDAAGRLQSATYPSGSIVTFNYDPNGNRKLVTCTPGASTADCTVHSNTTGTITPGQAGAIQAILSILLGQ